MLCSVEHEKFYNLKRCLAHHGEDLSHIYFDSLDTNFTCQVLVNTLCGNKSGHIEQSGKQLQNYGHCVLR